MAERSLVWDEQWKEYERLIGYKSYWKTLRSFKTMSERRCNSDPEYKPFIRAKRKNLPDAWNDEKPINREKTWKARSRVKRQWQVNLQIHIDYVRYEKCTDVFADDVCEVEHDPVKD